MKPELIVALDLSSAAESVAMADRLGTSIGWYKVGLELFTAEGPAALAPLKARGKKIFLDLKLHDIPNTLARAVTSAGRLGVNLLTLHAAGGKAMIQAAADAAHALGDQAPKLICVTTLTSLSQQDLSDIGITRTVSDQALALGRLALAAGADGLVTSVHEAAALRQALGPAPILVTPGIRPSGGAIGDQKRVATPALAVKSGSSFLVVGRPILEAHDPKAAAEAIQDEMRIAL